MKERSTHSSSPWRRFSRQVNAKTFVVTYAALDLVFTYVRTQISANEAMAAGVDIWPPGILLIDPLILLVAAVCFNFRGLVALLGAGGCSVFLAASTVRDWIRIAGDVVDPLTDSPTRRLSFYLRDNWWEVIRIALCIFIVIGLLVRIWRWRTNHADCEPIRR